MPTSASAVTPPSSPPSPPSPTELPLPARTVELGYAGEQLFMVQAGNQLRFAGVDGAVELPATPGAVASVGDRSMALGLFDGSLWLSGWWGDTVVPSPLRSPVIRLAGRPGLPQLAAWTREALLVWNLESTLPRAIAADGAFMRVDFVGDDEVVLTGPDEWRRIALRGSRPSSRSQPVPVSLEDPTLHPQTGAGLTVNSVLGTVDLVPGDGGPPVAVWREGAHCAAFTRQGVAVGTRAGAVLLGQPAALREVVRLDSEVLGVAGLSSGGVVAVSARGEVASFDPATGAVLRGRLEGAPSGLLVADEDDGAVLAVGPDLVRWHRGALRELAHLDEGIQGLQRYRDHLIVETSRVSTVSLVGRAEVRRVLDASIDRRVMPGGRWVVGRGLGNAVEVVDLATGVRWARPRPRSIGHFAVSASGARLAALVRDELAVWTYQVPEEPEELLAWLHRATNCVVDAQLELAWASDGT